jgi:5-carboxymethyl-2-hydroxymuconate isomerase
MPHLVLEYSDNLTAHITIETLLSALHKHFVSYDTILPEETRTRALSYHHYEVGEKAKKAAFMHLSILLFKGRPQALRTQIGEGVLALLKQRLDRVPAQLPCDISIEIREMEKSDYFK